MYGLCGLGVARGVGRGVRSGLFMAVKVANNEDLNGDDSISRRRWSMSSVLGNVFHSYEALILWERILSSLFDESINYCSEFFVVEDNGIMGIRDSEWEE